MRSKAEWVKKFRQEATGQLQEIHQMLQAVDWERNAAQASPEGLEAEHKQIKHLFVRIHGMKGTAGMIGLTDVAEVAAELEALWGEVMGEPSLLNQFLHEVTLAKLEELTGLIETIKVE